MDNRKEAGKDKSDFFNRDKKKLEEKKNLAKKTIPVTWFVLTIIIAIVLSFLISLVIFNISYASAREYSTDSGTIIVQIQPDLGSNTGTINVEINGEEVKTST